MKIGVIGAGAMGGLYGAILAKHGHDVTFVDVYAELVEVIRSKGITLVEGTEKYKLNNVRAYTKAPYESDFELVIVFVKSLYTESAITANQHMIGPNTTVLTLQNGLGNIEALQKIVSAENIMAGSSANGASSKVLGEIIHGGNGGTVLGELNGKTTDRTERIRDALNVKELGPATISNNILGIIWDKLMANIGINAITALTGLSNGGILNFEGLTKLSNDAVKEALRIAQAKGINLISESPIEHCREIIEATKSNRSSMLSDVTNHRKTEIDTINGAIVEEGKLLGIETPANVYLTGLIKGLEKSYLR